MTNDERVERVMQGLGSAETPSGMESRVLARVAAMERSERTSPGFGWAWGMAVAATLLVAVAVGVHGRRRVEDSTRSASAGGVSGSAQALVARAGEGVPQRLQPLASPAEYGTANAVPISKTRKPVERAAVGMDRRENAEGLQSFPAPPEPLTAQEKLLVKVARNGDRNDDFELLNPETVDVALATEDAEMAEMIRQGRLAPMHGEYLKQTRHN